MKAFYRYLIAAVLILSIGNFWERGWAEEVRVWTDSNGREIRASLMGFKDKDTLILRLGDGRSLPYSINKLSGRDGKFAREAYAKQLKNDTKVGIDWDNPKQSENYVIRGVRRQNAPGFVSTKAGWEWQVKSIEVKVQYKGRTAKAPGDIRAYFYNRQGKLIEMFNKPPRRQDENRKYINAPKEFKKNKTMEVYFPITPFLEDSKWAMVLVVFGTGSEFSAETMSGKRFGGLEFSEKEHLFPGWSPIEEGTGVGQGSVDLEIRRVQHQKKYGYFLIFDGNYRENKPCVLAEVRAKGKISPGTGTVELYVFDKSGKLVGSRTRPSSAAVKGSESYVDRPQIAKDEWYPVFFALDGELKDSYSSYVIVFKFGGKAVAAIKSTTGATIETLDFPGKKELTPSGGVK